MNPEHRRRLPLPVGASCIVLACGMLAGCATTDEMGEDPLRNTRKLVAEGHASLYRNGAFQVPHTSVRLIPSGPDASALALELAGVNARDSFIDAVRKAADSVDVVAVGAKKSYRVAGELSEETGEIARRITDASRQGGVVLIDRSLASGKKIVGSSWDTAKHMMAARGSIGDRMVDSGTAFGSGIARSGNEAGKSLSAGSIESAKSIAASATTRTGEGLPKAGERFVRGYAALPTSVDRRAGRVGDKLTQLDPRIAAASADAWRQTWSKKSADLMSTTVRTYGMKVGESLDKAVREFSEEKRHDGVSLATIRSLRWILQAVFWDATIEPLGNLTLASVGYLGVNLVAFPTMVVVREGVSVTELAVEVTRDVGSTAWDLVAPTGTAAVASIFHAVDFLGSQTVAGATAVGGVLAGQSLRAGSQVVGVTVKAGSHVTGRTVEYIGIPLAAAGVTIGGGVVGTVVGGVGSGSGGLVLVGGEAAGAGTQVFGNLIAGTTLAGGTALSVVGGGAYGVYQVSRAVVVPVGYELGSGLVISYTTATQLGAQSILAVSDCAYLVLSLEGPRWVIYAIRGTVSDGSDLVPGAVVDLKALQAGGEEILNVPVSDEEIKRVVEAAYENLPQAPPARP